MILYDPSEAREGSRLPVEVLRAGRPLAGLERLTGADLLVTRADFSLYGIAEDMPAPLLACFQDACKSGVLIQRKSGMDLAASLEDFNDVLYRMLRWTSEPWLVGVGEVVDRSGQAVVDGQTTAVRSASLAAKLTWWQRRGGYYIQLPGNGAFVVWIARWEAAWLEAGETKTLLPRKPAQSLVPAGWWEKLTLLPGFGEASARAVAEWLPEGCKTMADALMYLSDLGYYERNNHPSGVGPSHFTAVRQWLGLQENQALMLTDPYKKDVVDTYVSTTP